jgi:hypothetical protein
MYLSIFVGLYILASAFCYLIIAGARKLNGPGYEFE